MDMTTGIIPLLGAIASLLGAIAAFVQAARKVPESSPPDGRGTRRWIGVAFALTLVTLIALVAALVIIWPRPLSAKDLEGHWYGTFGNTYFKVDGAEVKGVYTYRDGRLAGTFHGGTVDGQWSEGPTRKPPNQAGLVHFILVKEGDTLRIEGGWSLGEEANWRTWLLTKVDEEIPIDIRAELEKDSSFPQS